MVEDGPPENGSVVSVSLPNGVLRHHHSDWAGRKVHDGFATIRAGASKRGRAHSTPSVPTSAAAVEPSLKTCHGCYGGVVSGGSQMEPLWEERNGVGPIRAEPPVTRREAPKVPWWEVATRRSKYRSCPAFSQANIVSALEQTVSDVTDRLERLASSPDLKISEADELRRSVALLRRQSSAVSQSVSSGYFSLERQASCDSVSSVTSSATTVTHASSFQPRRTPDVETAAVDVAVLEDASKMKKRNWLRASFRRAFGRKRTKTPDFCPAKNGWNSSLSGSQIQASHDNRDQRYRYHSCHSLVRGQQRPPGIPCYDQGICDRDSSKYLEIISHLQRMVTEKKLEQISAQSTIKEQDDLITKLKIEIAHLKEENDTLTNLVQSKFGSVSQASAAPGVEYMALTNCQNNGIYATVGRLKGKKMKLNVVENVDIAEVAKDAIRAFEPGSSAYILAGSVSIFPKTKWEDLDNMVAETFQEYCSRLDPGTGLGLGRECLLCYQLGEALRAEGLPDPDLLPYGYCVGNVEGIYLSLKGPHQKDSEYPYGNVASLSFHHGIPSSTMQRLVSLLQETRRLVIVGPCASGKTALAHQLARYFVSSKGLSLGGGSITIFRANGSNSLELCQLLLSVSCRGKRNFGHLKKTEPEDSSPLPRVLVIANLQAASGVVETLQRCLSLNINRGPAIIATLHNAPILLTKLQVHCSFRWLRFSVQDEPVRGALGRQLRRVMLAAEIGSGLTLPLVHRSIEWLTRLWVHLNQSFGADEPLGPMMLKDCPLDQEEARRWFISKWNDILVPTVRENLKGVYATNDPKEWIVSTVPWKIDADDLLSLISKPYSGATRQTANTHPALTNGKDEAREERTASAHTKPSEGSLTTFVSYPEACKERGTKYSLHTFTPILYSRENKKIIERVANVEEKNVK